MPIFKKNVSLGTKDLLWGEDDLANKSVTSEKIADGTIKSDNIAEGAIETENIADNAVTQDKLYTQLAEEDDLEAEITRAETEENKKVNYTDLIDVDYDDAYKVWEETGLATAMTETEKNEALAYIQQAKEYADSAATSAASVSVALATANTAKETADTAYETANTASETANEATTKVTALETKSVTVVSSLSSIPTEGTGLTYIIRDEITNTETVTLKNSTLLFMGGKITGGTLNLSDVTLIGKGDLSGTTLTGNIRGKLSSDLFGFVSDGATNNIYAMYFLIKAANTLYADIDIVQGKYLIKRVSADKAYTDKGIIVSDDSMNFFPITKVSVNFNNSTIYWSTGDMQNFQWIFSNGDFVTETSSSASQVILDAVKEKLFYSALPQLIDGSGNILLANAFLTVENSENEIRRYGDSVSKTKSEMFYVDQYGHMNGDIFNKSMSTDTMYIQYFTKPSRPIIIENLDIAYQSDVNTEESGYTQDGMYRTIGIAVKRSINTIMRNIYIDASAINTKHCTVDGFIYLSYNYNIQVDNLVLTNTRDDSTSIEYGEAGLTTNSSYVIMADHLLHGYLNNIEIDNTRGNSWGSTGMNYISDFNFVNIHTNRIDCHWRMHNVNIDRCRIEKEGITYSGSGYMNITNCTFENLILHPRVDYQNLWDGEINIINCTFRCGKATSDSLIGAGYVFLGSETGTFENDNYDIVPTIAKQVNIKNLTIDGQYMIRTLYKNDDGTIVRNFGKNRTIYILNLNCYDTEYKESVVGWKYRLPDIKIDGINFINFDSQTQYNLFYRVAEYDILYQATQDTKAVYGETNNNFTILDTIITESPYPQQVRDLIRYHGQFYGDLKKDDTYTLEEKQIMFTTAVNEIVETYLDGDSATGYACRTNIVFDNCKGVCFGSPAKGTKFNITDSEISSSDFYLGGVVKDNVDYSCYFENTYEIENCDFKYVLSGKLNDDGELVVANVDSLGKYKDSGVIKNSTFYKVVCINDMNEEDYPDEYSSNIYYLYNSSIVQKGDVKECATFFTSKVKLYNNLIEDNLRTYMQSSSYSSYQLPYNFALVQDADDRWFRQNGRILNTLVSPLGNLDVSPIIDKVSAIEITGMTTTEFLNSRKFYGTIPVYIMPYTDDDSGNKRYVLWYTSEDSDGNQIIKRVVTRTEVGTSSTLWKITGDTLSDISLEEAANTSKLLSDNNVIATVNEINSYKELDITAVINKGNVSVTGWTEEKILTARLYATNLPKIDSLLYDETNHKILLSYGGTNTSGSPVINRLVALYDSANNLLKYSSADTALIDSQIVL